MSFILLNASYPVAHPIYIAVGYITALEENAINENSRGSIVHMGESSFIVDEDQQEVLSMMLKTVELSR